MAIKMNFKNRIFVPAFLTLSLQIAFTAYSQTVSTPIVGFQKITAPQGGVAIGPTFVKSTVFSGNASISGTSVSLAAGALTGQSLGPSTYSDRTNYPRFYAEVVSTNSPFYGYNFDISSNTSNAFVSDNIPVGLIGSVNIVIRPHFTLGDLDTASLNDGDSVNFVNDPTGQQATFYAIGGNWYDSGFNPGYSHKPIYPGEAVVFAAQSGEVTITLTGQVKLTPTAVPLSMTSYANLVTAINPSASVNWAAQDLTAFLNDGAAFTVYTGDGSFTEESTFYTISGQIFDASFSPISSAIPVQGGTGINIGSLDTDKVIILPGVSVN